MGRRPSPRSVALRDQILAILRDRGVATTTEIREAIRQETSLHAASPGLSQYFERPSHRAAFQWEIYPQLDALARLGVIGRVNPGGNPVAWMLAAEKVEAS